MKPKNKIAVVEELAANLLDHLKVKAEIEVKEEPVKSKKTEKKEKLVFVQLETEDPGILIGYHGEALYSFQLILALMVYRQTGEWTRILVNVGDYREKRQESLERMALSAAQRVKFSGEEFALPTMTPSERRIIHLTLAEDKEVETESEGDSGHRRVVVKPKK